MTPYQQLMHFTFFLLRGSTPWDAYCEGGLAPEGVHQLTLAEQTLHRLRAEQLAADPRVGVLMKVSRDDPRALLRGSIGLAVIGMLDLAFNGRSERTRLKALTEIMNRGGLPAESVSLSGRVNELQKLTDKELESEILKLMV